MLGQLPTPNVIAMLQAMRPAKAVEVLLGLPADRVTVLLGALPRADLVRLFAAAGPARRVEVLGAAPADRVPDLLTALTLPAAAELIAGLPAERATLVLAELPAEARCELAGALPAAARTQVYDAMEPASAGELASAVYQRRLISSVGRMAAVVARPGPGDLVGTVLDSRVQVAVRPAEPGRRLTAETVHEAVVGADWSGLNGLLVVTDRSPDERAAAHARTIRGHGYRLELLRWVDERDDGLLKRALVRLAERAQLSG